MAMVVANNTAAVMILGVLNKNNSKLKKDLQKAASGMRINDAADDVSGFAISEKMRARIRSLSQDIENVQNGHSLLKTGLGGVDNIVEELRTLKELALNSCNDHNSEVDRATLQKEFDARKAHIDYIANDTNFNGIPLLDGRWGKQVQTVISSGTEGGTTSKLISQTVERNVTKTSSTSETLAPTTTTQTIMDPAQTATVTTTKTVDTNPGETTTTEGPNTSTATESKNTTEGPTTTVISSNTSNDDETVTTEGDRTTIVKKDTTTSTKTRTTVDVKTDTTTTTTVTKTITTSVEEKNVTKPGEPKILYKGDTTITEDGVYEFDPEYTGNLYISAKNVQLQGPKTGETIKDLYISGPVDNLYLKNLKIENSKDTSTIAFRQTNTNNTLHLLGSNSIFIKGAATRETNNAVINAGGGLTIVGGGSMDIKVNGFQYGAMIGSDKGGSCGDIAIGQNVNISIVKNHHGSAGAGIGSGGGNGGGSCGNITIGTGAKVYIDMCQSSITYIAGFTAAAAIGSGDAFYSRPKCGNITIYSGADVTATAWYGAGIGSSTWSSECGNITIYSDAKVTAKSKEGADIGAGYYEDGYTTKVGNITIYSYLSGNVKADTIGSNSPKAIVGYIDLLDMPIITRAVF